jgi:hypothetical protein
LDIAVTKDLPFRVYLTSCSALSSGHLPVLIDIACRSSFRHPSDRPNFRRLPDSLGRSDSARSGIAQCDGNRHVL